MEERLRNFTPRPPGPDLRRRVIEAARREGRATVWDRIYASRLFWAGAAAAVAAAFLLTIPPGRPAPIEKAAVVSAARPSQLARSLAEMLGDGPEVERWLALRLERRAGVGRSAAGEETYGEFLEAFKCQG